jgi:hypothetical protein
MKMKQQEKCEQADDRIGGQSSDDMEWDEIIESEDNPFNNPDTSFEDEDSAYDAGYELGKEDAEGGGCTVFDDIVYPFGTDDEVKEKYKEGYQDAWDDYTEITYGEGEEES